MGTTHFRYSDVEVGNDASYVKLDKTYGVKLTGIDQWDDMRFPVSAVKINPVTDKPDSVTIIGQTRGLGFDATASEWVTFNAQMSHAYREGTDIECHAHWMPSNTNTGTVVWQLEYVWANMNATYPSSVATAVGIAYLDGTARKHVYTDVAEISGTGKEISSMLLCRFGRNTDRSEDTYGADAVLIEVDFHYKKNTMGSKQENIK